MKYNRESLIYMLEPVMIIKCKKVIDICKKNGIDILVYDTVRTLKEQAILYRKTRTKTEIDLKIKKFKDRGFIYLADILNKVGPQSGQLGKHVTMAAPGESWHNYSKAFDAVPIIGNKPLWDTDEEEWQIYGSAVKEVGLEWAGTWKSFKEYPHVQNEIGSNPLKRYSPDEIFRILKKAGSI